MRINSSSWRIGYRRAWLCLGVVLAITVNDGAAEPNQVTKLDCGVNALFVLLQVEGHGVTLDRIESVLPPRHPDGYSMAELSAAAGSFGVHLDGIRFAKADKALTRSAIAFLKDGKGGHFAVLRPVGTTGTMVQVIDPPSAPWIADYDRVFSAKPWTGRILVARDAWIVRNAMLLLTAVAGFILLAAAFRHRLRLPRRCGAVRSAREERPLEPQS